MINIKINFSDSWENSFLSGDLYDPQKERRRYTGSGSSGFDNYKHIQLTERTVLGILYRLVGEQRKLVSILDDPNRMLKNIENKISFMEEIESLTEDIVYLRNMEKDSYEKTGFSGPKPDEDTELFSNKYFDKIWSPLVSTPKELEDFLVNNIALNKKVSLPMDRIEIGKVMGENIEKNKSHDGSNNYKKLDGVDQDSVLASLEKAGLLTAEDVNKGLSYKIMVYCSIYKIVKDLGSEFAEKNLTKNGNIKGLAKRSFTPKDFMTSAEKKKVVGNPSKWSGFISVEGSDKKKKIDYYLKRKNGTLIIRIDSDHEESKQILKMIESAGVGPFVVGKKGLAYIDAIWEE